MRGGIVQHDKVEGFIRLINLLFALKIISYNEYMKHRSATQYINPLVSSNKIFIKSFKEIDAEVSKHSS